MASARSQESGEAEPPPPYRTPSVGSSISSSSSSEDEQEEYDLCQECDARHIRRRLVICADGTWMVADGAIGAFSGNASNMARIWSMVKEGIVRSPDGMPCMQKRVFVPGIGAVTDLIQRTYAGVTGHGYAAKIKFVYKLCCTNMCSGDEIFFFGYSRGAFVVRAVAGLLHHLGMLDVTLPDFDQRFDDALRLYRATQDKSRLQQHSVFQLLSETKKSPRIKFMGLIDTVKALNDDHLHDIGVLKSVSHVRHALAMFEKRAIMSPERFDLSADLPANHSIQEAWFVGTHGNLGGSCQQDGLSLYPLHWLVSEAKRQNLVFGFKRINSSNVTDPAALIFQRQGDAQRDFHCQNGIKVALANLSAVMSKDGFLPVVDVGKGKFPSPKEIRPMFAEQKLIGRKEAGTSSAFVHPSVFFLDDTDASSIYAMLSHPECSKIRAERQFSISSIDTVFWAGNEELRLHHRTKCPRILLCGQLNAGKSSLINRILNCNTTHVSHDSDPGEHDINVGHYSRSRRIILHDSQGFEASKASNYEDVEYFVGTRRAQPILENHIHCIWYCVSTDLQRVQKVDKKFAKIDFGGVPVILVFTKTDKLKSAMNEKAMSEFNQETNSRLEFFRLGGLPEANQQRVLSRAYDLLEHEKERRSTDWNRKFPELFCETIFVSNPEIGGEDTETISRLMRVSVDSMTGDRIAQIHAHSQDNYISAKWKEALDAIIEICDKKGDFISCILKHDKRKLQFQILKQITEKLALIFGLEGFNGDVAFPIMREILYPDSSARNSSVVQVLTWAASITLASVASVLLTPIVVGVAGASLASMMTVGENMSNSNAIVLSCLEIAFVLERVFWFGASQVDATMVKAATLYYLKRRLEIVTYTDKALSVFDTVKEMRPKLAEVVARFRYQRQNAQHKPAEEGVSSPGS